MSRKPPMIQLARRMTTPPLTVLASVLALSLLAAACSGSDSPDSAADADGVAADTEPEAAGATSEDSAEGATDDAQSSDVAVETAEADQPGDDAGDVNSSTDAATSEVAPDDSTAPDEPDASEPDTGEPDTSEPDISEDEELELELDQPESDGDRIVSDGADAINGTDLEQILPFFGITDPAEAVVCIEEEARSEGLTLDELSAGAGNGVMIAAVRCRPEPMRELFATEFGQIDSSAIAATPAQLECGFDTLLGWFPTVPLAEANDVFDGTAPDEVVDLIAKTCEMSREDANAFLNDA